MIAFLPIVFYLAVVVAVVCFLMRLLAYLIDD